MKKFMLSSVALFMSVLLPLVQVQASEVTLESAISNLKYRLTVEWDQKDLSVQKEIVSQFYAQVDQLKKQGVSETEILRALATDAFDAQTAKDIEQLAQYVKVQKLDQASAHRLIVDYVKNQNKTGTSWSPEAGEIVLMSVLLISISIGIYIWLNSSGGGLYCWNEYVWDPFWGWVLVTYCY